MPTVSRSDLRTWRADVDRWALHLAERGLSTATIEGYVRHASWAARDLAGLAPAPWDLRPDDLARWLPMQDWSPRTANKVAVSLRALFRWGESEGLCTGFPLDQTGRTLRRPGPPQVDTAPAWRRPLDDFTTYLKAGGRRPSTIENRRWWLQRWSRVQPEPWRATTDGLAAWLANPVWAPATRRAGLSAVRAFYGWAAATGRVRADPAARLLPVRVPRSLPMVVPDEALRVALTVTDGRVRRAAMLAGLAGLRRAEVARACAEDAVDGRLRVVGKGGHERWVPLHPRLEVELAGAGPGWLFPSTQGQHLTPAYLARLVSRELPDGITMHHLRHRFATKAYEAQHDLRAVQELLGHRSPETTARYIAAGVGSAREAVDGVWP